MDSIHNGGWQVQSAMLSAAQKENEKYRRSEPTHAQRSSTQCSVSEQVLLSTVYSVLFRIAAALIPHADTLTF